MFCAYLATLTGLLAGWVGISHLAVQAVASIPS